MVAILPCALVTLGVLIDTSYYNFKGLHFHNIRLIIMVSLPLVELPKPLALIFIMNATEKFVLDSTN